MVIAKETVGSGREKELQGCIYKDSMFHCCNYCLYQEDCFKRTEGNRKMYFLEVVRERLQNITGVHLGKDVCNIEEKFLQNFSSNY